MALTICTNSGLSEAPPTRNPSTSGLLASSLQLLAVTEPVNNSKTNYLHSKQNKQRKYEMQSWSHKINVKLKTELKENWLLQVEYLQLPKNIYNKFLFTLIFSHLFHFKKFYYPFQVKICILCCQCKYSTCTYIFFWHVHLWMHITAHISGLTPSSQAQSLVCMVITKQVGQEKEQIDSKCSLSVA